MKDFVYVGFPTRVVFGVGSLDRLGDEIEKLGARRALVLATADQREQAEQVLTRLGPRGVAIFDKASPHVPIEIAHQARAEATRLGADCCVTVGGGSTTGLGKAIALAGEMPILAVPTTYAGSEMTNIWGITEDGIKKTGRDDRVRPRVVLYDPTLTLSLPAALSATSGMNAVAHAVEARYAPGINPIIALVCEEGVRAMAASLPRVVHNPKDIDARSDALYGAWLCAVSFSTMGMGLHHRLCHVLGGTYNLPHAETHTVVLPYAVAYNRQWAKEAMAAMSRALGTDDPVRGLYDLNRAIRAPKSLAEIGMKQGDLDRAAALTAEITYENPVKVTVAGVRRVLEEAFRGDPPSAALDTP